MEFYQDNCPKCQELAPIYKEAAYNAKQLGLNITFTRIEAKNNITLTEWNIYSFPKLYFYSNGIKYPYSDKKTVKGFFRFIDSELSLNFTENELNQSEIIKNEVLINNNRTVVLFIGDINATTKEFLKYRRLTDDYKKIDYYYSKDQVFLNKFNIKPDSFGLVIYKFNLHSHIFEEGKLMDLSDYSQLKTVLKFYATPIFRTLKKKTLEKIVEEGTPSLVLIFAADKNRSISKQYLKEFSSVAENYKDKLRFLKIDFLDNKMDELLNLFRIDQEELPAIILLDAPRIGTDDMIKYKHERNISQPLTQENFKLFIENWENRKLEKFVASEKIPLNPINEYGVKHVVWNSFKEFIETDKNLILLICTDLDDDDSCFEMRKRFNEISRRLNSTTNCLFSVFDPVKNENEFLNLENVPEILVFPRGENKLKQMKTFSGILKTEDIIDFIKKSATNPELIIENLISEVEILAIKQELPIQRRKLDDDVDQKDGSDDDNNNDDDINDDNYEDKNDDNNNDDVKAVEPNNKREETKIEL